MKTYNLTGVATPLGSLASSSANAPGFVALADVLHTPEIVVGDYTYYIEVSSGGPTYAVDKVRAAEFNWTRP